MSEGTTVIYRFGPFRLDPSRWVLERGGEAVPLTPRLFDTLVFLVKNHGRIVTKEELLRTVWKGTFVDENNLAQAISVLRRTLGDGPDGNGYIATVIRRGYRFVAAVTEFPDAREPIREIASTAAPLSSRLTAPDSAPSSRRRARRVWGIAAVIALAALFVAWIAGRGRASPALSGVQSIAVLPFKSLVPTDTSRYFGLALTDAVITRLGYFGRLSVRPTSAVLSFANGDPVAAGKALSVDAVLDGWLQESNGRIRVTVQLIGVKRGTSLWTEKFDVERSELFRLEDSLSEALADRLTLRLSGAAASRGNTRPAPKPEAYEAYLRGRYFWNRRTPESFRKAADLFRQAIAADPTYAPAHAGLALTDNFLRLHVEAKEVARRALQLDPNLAEAHASLGNTALLQDWDFPRADRELRRALGLNPSCATARQWFAYLLVAEGRLDEAIAQIQRARETDPLSLPINTDVAHILYLARRFDEAERESRKALELDPNFDNAHIVLGLVLLARSRFEEGIREFGAPTASRALACALAGRKEEAARILDAEQNVTYLDPLALAALGRTDRAFRALDELYREHWGEMILLAADPLYDPLRRDPRFTLLLRKVGLS